MSRIIPAILTNDLKELKNLAILLSPKVELLHLDVMDSTFVTGNTIHNPESVKNLATRTPFEAHLMIDNPEKHVESWIMAGAARVAVHVESRGNIGLAIETIKRYNRKAGIVLNPDSRLEDFEDLLQIVDFVQLMGVVPGAQGREFHESIFDTIGYIKKQYPNLRIAVDGGVNESNIIRLVRAGVEDLVVGSAIVKQENPIEALTRLQSYLQTNY